jgi:heme exporter protein D
MQLTYVYGAYGVTALALIGLAVVFVYQHLQLCRKIQTTHDA